MFLTVIRQVGETNFPDISELVCSICLPCWAWLRCYYSLNSTLKSGIVSRHKRLQRNEKIRDTDSQNSISPKNLKRTTKQKRRNSVITVSALRLPSLDLIFIAVSSNNTSTQLPQEPKDSWLTPDGSFPCSIIPCQTPVRLENVIADNLTITHN